MAMPFIFGNHRCPFDFLRFMMRPQHRLSWVSEPAREKIRGRGINRKTS